MPILFNLHSHLDGRVRRVAAAELGARIGLPDRPAGWADALELDGPADLTVSLGKVAGPYPFFGDPESLARTASEAVQDAATAAARAAGDGVVGFDLADDEELFCDLAPYEEASAIAAAADLGLTCHAAEAAPGPAARDAVERFGVRRIGPGTHVPGDPGTLDWIADHGVVIEVCPTSNWYTGGIDRITDHPARTFLDHRVDVVLGDDNPRQIRSPLSVENPLLHSTLGLDAADPAAIEAMSIEVAFADDSVRAAWRDL